MADLLRAEGAHRRRGEEDPRAVEEGGALRLLYLDENYLSGIAKRKPAFHELEPALREAVACDAVEHDLPERRTRLDLRHECELFSGRRADVLRLRDRLRALTRERGARTT